MAKKYNRILVGIAKHTGIALLSFMVFHFVFSKVLTDAFMGIFAAAVFILLVAVLDKRNLKKLIKLMIGGWCIAIGFVLAKFSYGCGPADFFSNWTWIRKTTAAMIVLETISVAAVLVMAIRAERKERDETKNKEKGLFSERVADLERLEEYIKSFGVIGVNGKWGSGKTFLVGSFCEKHKSEYEIIKVEPLTCNLDRIDSFLFNQLEQSLWKDRIYPQYSRRLQKWMARNNWADSFLDVLNPDILDDVTAFGGFCQDLDKLDTPILLIYEDIDRIFKENTEQIAKLLDISEKLQYHNVKVVYEFDLEKMSALGYDHEYIEKYIPYMINITAVPANKMLAKALEGLEQVNAGLETKDFDFLFQDIYLESFLKKMFGFQAVLHVEMNYPTPRKMETFVSEVNLAMGNQEYAEAKNRRTVIAFYFMKHFFPDIYESLRFTEDMIDEVQLTFYSKDGKVQNSYTVMELIAGCKAQAALQDSGEEEKLAFDFTLKDIQAMLSDGGSDGNDDIMRQNRNKLGLLLLMGYIFKFQQVSADLEQKMENDRNTRVKGGKAENVLLNQDEETLKNIDNNKKISCLIKNLHANGKSELTDDEAFAETFIECVLKREETKWEDCWNDFKIRAFHGEIRKNSQTIFRWGENEFVSLFRALSIYLSRREFKLKEKERIMDKALDFYFRIGRGKDELDLDKIVIFHFCDIVSNRIFIKVLEHFVSFDITGNMNRERVYRLFLKKYLSHAFMWGYISRYDPYRLDIPFTDKPDKYADYIKEYLQECCDMLEKVKKESAYHSQCFSELELVLAFFRKNIEIVEAKNRAKQTGISFHTEVKSVEHHMNEKQYERLKAFVSEAATEEEIAAALAQAYEKEEINLREYQELLKLYRQRK